MSVRAIIFDKDGTLHDTEEVYMQAWKPSAEVEMLARRKLDRLMDMVPLPEGED